MIQEITGSKVDIHNISDPEIAEFRNIIYDLLNNQAVLKLENYTQHKKTTRLQHSVNVAYYSYKIAKLIGADPYICARAGLLHDFYWYKHIKKSPIDHAYFHPKLAVKNAEKITNLSEREKDAISKHMWPLSKGLPKYKESYAVSMADKYSAFLEYTIIRKSKKRLS